MIKCTKREAVQVIRLYVTAKIEEALYTMGCSPSTEKLNQEISSLLDSIYP